MSIRGRLLRTGFGLAVTALLLRQIVGQVDFQYFYEALGAISSRSIMISLGFLATGYFTRIFRWWWMLRIMVPSVQINTCARPFLVSIALNNILPFRVGDVVRVFGFCKELQLPALKVLGTLMIERLLDLLVLLAMIFIGLQFLSAGRIPERIRHFSLSAVIIGLFTIMIIMCLPRMVNSIERWIASRRIMQERGWVEPFTAQLENLHISLKVIHSSATNFLVLIISSVLVWVLEAEVFATIASALAPEIPGIAAWFAMSAGTLATLLPSSPGYVGTFDYFAMLGLSLYGASSAIAAAFSFVVHLILWLPLTLIGMVLYFLPRAYPPRNDGGAKGVGKRGST